MHVNFTRFEAEIISVSLAGYTLYRKLMQKSKNNF